MNANELKKRAMALGIQPGKKPRREIILEIQRAEGNTPCFGANDGSCRYADCCWFDDCEVQRRKGGS